MFDCRKTRMIELPCGEETDNALNHFARIISERDGQTDRHNCYINIALQHNDARWKWSKNTQK